MADEQKKDTEASNSDEQQDEQDESQEESNESESSEDEDGSDSKNSDKTNYEEIIAREREAREKAEKALAERRFKESQQKREAEGQDDDEKKPLTKSELRALLAEERELNRKEIFNARIQEIAQSLSADEAERNAIIEVHRNRTYPEHLSLQEQLEEAYVVVNRKRLVGERNEAMRALRGKKGTTSGAASTHRDGPQAGAPKMRPQDRAAIEGSGFTFNPATKRYEKKLKKGILVRDSKTGDTRFFAS